MENGEWRNGNRFDFFLPFRALPQSYAKRIKAHKAFVYLCGNLGSFYETVNNIPSVTLELFLIFICIAKIYKHAFQPPASECFHCPVCSLKKESK